MSRTPIASLASTRYTDWKKLAHLLEEVGIDANSLLGRFTFTLLLAVAAAALTCIACCSCLTLKVALYFEQCIDECDNKGCCRSLLCENGEDVCHKWKRYKKEQGGKCTNVLTKADIHFAPHYDYIRELSYKVSIPFADTWLIHTLHPTSHSCLFTSNPITHLCEGML